jgi:hypothetical protein
MAQGDLACAAATPHACKKTIPFLARGSFERGFSHPAEGHDIHFLRLADQSELLAELANQNLILFRRTRPEPMVHMGDGELPTVFHRQMVQDAQQGDRVRPARNRDHDGVAVGQHAMPYNGLFYLFNQIDGHGLSARSLTNGAAAWERFSRGQGNLSQ